MAHIPHQSLFSIPAIRTPFPTRLTALIAIFVGTLIIVFAFLQPANPHDPNFDALYQFCLTWVPWMPLPGLILCIMEYLIRRSENLSDDDMALLLNYLARAPHHQPAFDRWIQTHPLRYDSIGPLCQQIGLTVPLSSALWNTLRFTHTN